MKEQLESFTRPNYKRVKRSSETYATTAKYTYEQLKNFLEKYLHCSNNPQEQRLVRDTIEYHLRRYHGYCIKEKFGSHYRQRNIQGEKRFEHMIPIATVRDLLIAGFITPEQACNVPTCTLSKENDIKLRQAGWVSDTPSIYQFWGRYASCFEIEGVFETYDGKDIDTKMTLEDHFDIFLN